MRIIIGFLVMGLLGFIAAVLAAISVLIQMLPLIAVVLGVALVIRVARRRQAHREAPATRAATRSMPVAARPLQPQRAIPSGGWVLVPMWVTPRQIDAEVIDPDGRHV